MGRKRPENSFSDTRRPVSVCGATKVENAKVSVSSRLNIPDAALRSLSTIHRSTSVLPSSLLDLDVASTAGLHIIRPETHPAAFVPLPPDGGWGWVIVFAAFLTNLVIDGICVSFGVMANDLVESFNTSVAKVMLTGSFLAGFYQLVGPIAAGLVNKFGCRTIGVTGALLASVSVFASAFAPTIEIMMVVYGVIAGISFGFLHLPTVVSVSFYFDSKRALAIGIAVCGSPIGAMIFAPLTETLLSVYGWSNTFIFLSGILLNCAVLACLYRPLTPAIMLKPMTQEDVDAIAPLLLAEGKGGEEGPAVADQELTTSAGRGLQNQPLIEEEEEEEEQQQHEREEKKATDKQDVNVPDGGGTLASGSDTAAQTAELSEPPVQSDTMAVDASDTDKLTEPSPADEKFTAPHTNHHHRHHRHRHRKEQPPALQQIIDSFSWWRKQVRHKNEQAKSARHKTGTSEASGDESSSAFESSCSSCEDASDADSEEGGTETALPGSSRAGRTRASLSATTGPMTQERSDVDVAATTTTEAEEDSEARDQLRPLVAARPGRMRTSTVSTGRPRPPPEIVVGDHDKRKRRQKRAPASSECILSTPNLGLGGPKTRAEGWLHLKGRTARQRMSEVAPPPQAVTRKPSRIRRTSQCPDRIPRASVVTMAHMFPMRSVSVCIASPQAVLGPRESPAALTPSWTGSQGVQVSTGSGLGDEAEKALKAPLTTEELSGPFLVELPHESITIEDYARPLYRKDIFFPGSVKRQMESTSSAGSIAMSKSSIATPTTAAALVITGGGAGESLAGGVDGLGVRRHKASSVSQFGSSLTFGDNIPLPTTVGAVTAPGLAVVTKDGQDVNWTGSCIMTLTKIPLPDVFEAHPREEEESAALWEKLKQDSGLLLTDTPADGIFRVPRSKTQCGWWLCWRTHYYYSSDEEDEVEEELTKEKMPLKKLPEDDQRQHRHMKVPQLPHLPEKAELVLRRTCEFMPKSIWDVITTMLDFSLLKSKSLFLLCLSSLIAVIGMYVPLFFVCDIADSFKIPKSQSSLLLTCYGAANACSRLFFAWAAGQPKFSSLLATTFCLTFCGLATCFIPFWGTFVGQLTLLGAFGFCLAPFYSLTSIVLCEILGLEALTNAYGLLTLVRGVSSTVGSPLAGMVVESTGTFSVAFIGAGWTIMTGALLYGVVFLLQRAKNKKLAQDDAGDGLP
ncbi:hypothetical protein SprV_0200825200 [Sparganum proliferum]